MSFLHIVALVDSDETLSLFESRLPSSLSVIYASSCEKALELLPDKHADFIVSSANNLSPLLLNNIRLFFPNATCIFLTEDGNAISEDFFYGKTLKDDRQTRYSDKRTEQEIRKILLNIGISPNLNGYRYLTTGIRLTINQPEIINSVTTKLYPMIAELYGSTGTKIERSMRHALTVAWDKGRITVFNAIIGISTLNVNDRPTSSEFIALVADKILHDEILHE